MEEEVPVTLTHREWDIIVVLVNAGEEECPWAWSNDWPDGVDGDKAEEIAAEFRRRVREAQK